MEYEYLDLLSYIMECGHDSEDRTGTGTLSAFHNTLSCDLSLGFPLLTTKKMFLKGIIHELLWYIKGDTNVKYLQENGVRIWNEWADENGELGKVYGYQLRKYSGNIDQLQNVIDQIKNNPYGRRHIITLWNPAELSEMNLPPCHGLVIQFYVREGRLSCSMYQRSADMFLGVPFDIGLYALLTQMIAQVCDLVPGDLFITFGDTHIYKNHFDQVNEQISREPFDLPKMVLNPEIKNINDFKYEDFNLEKYQFHPSIKAPVAV